MTKRFCDDCKRELPVKAGKKGEIYYHVFIDMVCYKDRDEDSDEMEFELCPDCMKTHNFKLS